MVSVGVALTCAAGVTALVVGVVEDEAATAAEEEEEEEEEEARSAATTASPAPASAAGRPVSAVLAEAVFVVSDTITAAAELVAVSVVAVTLVSATPLLMSVIAGRPALVVGDVGVGGIGPSFVRVIAGGDEMLVPMNTPGAAMGGGGGAVKGGMIPAPFFGRRVRPGSI